MSDWERITSLFGAARLLDPDARGAFLDAACRGDSVLRAEVERVLADGARNDSFLGEPAWSGAFPPAAAPTAFLGAGDVLNNRYCIEASVATGGQAQVYRATDNVLSRPVVVKVMGATGHENRLIKSRFEREMQALSRIDHPGVVGILDVGELVDGSPFLVIQYVNGVSLREELQKGPLEPQRAAHLLRELGSALSAAHAAGIAHRDVKPENIMLQRLDDGSETLRLIDFGISKVDRADLEGGPTNVTVAGTIRYMAPEQFEGRHSAASDVYAVSLVACEMLSGYPDSRALPRQIGARTRKLLESALAFRPEGRPTDVRRWSDQVADALVAGPRSRWRHGWLIGAAAAAALVAGIQTARVFRRPAPAGEANRFVLPLPDGTSFPDGPGVLSLSPDGRRVVFATMPKGTSAPSGSRLWIRSLGSFTAQPLTAAGSAAQPFWSPDGRFVGFTDAVTSALKRIDPAGGPPTTLAERTNSYITDGARGTWSSRGVILFDGPDGVLYRVPEDGGAPAAVTRLDKARRETVHLWPSFLPDGNHFVFLAYSAPMECALYLASLDSPSRTRIADITSTAEYAAGYLFYQRQGTLIAHRFDEKTGRLLGDGQPVAESIRFNRENGRAAFSVSANGVLAFATGPSGVVTTLAWHDRAGKPLETVGPIDAYAYPRLSPDGTRVAVNRRNSESPWDVWVVDLERNVPSRLTFNNGNDYWPVVWSPDDSFVVFSAHRKDKPAFDLYRRSSDGRGADELLFESAEDKFATGFSPDGKLLLFNRLVGPSRDFDVWALPMAGERKPFPVLATPYDEDSAVFSPDGHWIAYVSFETGSGEIYAQPFPPTGYKVQLSADGGAWPTWTSDGRTIQYSTLNRLWSVGITMSGGLLRPGTPRLLFTQPFFGSGFGGFAADRSGDRFLLVVPAKPENESDSFKFILNWPALLTRR